MEESTQNDVPSQDEAKPARNGRKITRFLWFGLLMGLVTAVACPLNYGVLRAFIVIAAVGLWVGAVASCRKRKPLAVIVILAGLIPVVFLCLPGRAIAVDALRQEYVQRLRAYEGTRYVWGGENRFGIDCSGLVRRAMIDTNLVTGLRELNPRALRYALSIWWHDCTARSLKEQYREWTKHRFEAESINSIPAESLLPGDLAVTSGGVHVLAYLGDGVWIQADPTAAAVIENSVPDKSGWFANPVTILRWTVLCENMVSDSAFLTSERRFGVDEERGFP